MMRDKDPLVGSLQWCMIVVAGAAIVLASVFVIGVLEVMM